MITYEQAIKLTWRDHVHYTGPNARGVNNICTTTLGPRGGITVKTIECRVNGQVQTWKTRPTEFRVPIKYGMREYGEINTRNAGSWHLASECDEHYMKTLCAACGWTSSSDMPHNRYRGSLGVCRNAPQEVVHYHGFVGSTRFDGCGRYNGQSVNMPELVTCPDCMAVHGNHAGAEVKCSFRDESDLTPQLMGLEGWRVEVTDIESTTPRRFYVDRSTGWKPCHLEVNNRRSLGGAPAFKAYASVRRLYRR